MTYIATFYSHFGAIRFKKLCGAKGWNARVMPVPRDLSSSSGTCVRYEGTDYRPSEELPEEVEQIVQVTENGYVLLHKAEGA